MVTRAEFLPTLNISGNTPYGFFDNKAKFVSDTSRFCVWSRLKHGVATVSVELHDLDLFASMEEATQEYSSISSIYHARNTLPEYLGRDTGSNISSTETSYDDGTVGGLEKGYPIKTTNFLRRFAGQFADDVGVNGSYAVFSGTVTLQGGQQIYNLKEVLSSSNAAITTNSRLKVLSVYHDTPRVGLRYNAGAQYFENEFNMRSLPTNGMFQLFPVWPQMLYSMNFEMSNKMRRSFYSYELHGADLWVHPIPTAHLVKKVRIEYQIAPNDALNPDVDDGSTRGVGQFAEAPYGMLNYHSLNAFSRTWIRRYAFAVSKEILGNKRSKYQDIPYVDGNLRLNGDALMSQAIDEKTSLRDELKEWLESLSYKEMMTRSSETTEAASTELDQAPLGIYIG